MTNVARYMIDEEIRSAPDWGYYLTASGNTLDELLNDATVIRVDANGIEHVVERVYDSANDEMIRECELIIARHFVVRSTSERGVA